MQQTLEPWELRRLRVGPPTRMFVFDVRDDDDYGAPTRRMMVLAPSAEAAEALWDDEATEHNVFARPVFLKGRHLRLPASEPRVLTSGPFSAPGLVVSPSSEAA